MGVPSPPGPSEGNYLLALAGLAGSFIVSIATFAWRGRGVKEDLEKKIAQVDGSLTQHVVEVVSELRIEFSQKIEESFRQNGEGLAALRQKATDMELWSRDNFVRKTEFQNAFDSFTRSIDNLRSDMNAQYSRLGDKLDQIIQGKIGPTAPHR
jgi:hypothetical protein